MKRSLNLLTCVAIFLVATAQTTMGTTCLLFLNQPKVPECLLNDDK